MRRYASADALLLLCVTLWGLNVPMTKLGLEHGFSPLSYAPPRFGLGAFGLLGFMLARRSSFELPRRDWGKVAFWGGVVIALNQTVYMESFRLASPATIALLFGTLPLFAAIYAQVLGLDRLTARRWTGAAISFGGVALVALGASASVGGSPGGIALALVAPASFAALSIGLGPLLQSHGAVKVTTLASLCAVLPLFVVGAPALANQDWGAIDWVGWTALVYSAFVGYTITNLFWFDGVRKVGPARAALYVNVQPFSGAVFSWIILGDRIGWAQWAGGVLIVGGILFSRLPELRRLLAAAPHE